MIKQGDMIRVLRSGAYEEPHEVKVVYVDEETIGVEYEENLNLHSCGGLAKKGHGWYIRNEKGFIEEIVKDARFDELDEELLKQIDNNTVEGINIRINGNFIRVENREKEILLLANLKQDKIIKLTEIENKLEKKIINHILGRFEIKKGYGIDDNFKLTKVIEKQKEEDRKPVRHAKKKVINTKKVYETEEDLLRELGVDATPF